MMVHPRGYRYHYQHESCVRDTAADARSDGVGVVNSSAIDGHVPVAVEKMVTGGQLYMTTRMKPMKDIAATDYEHDVEDVDRSTIHRY